MVLAPTPEFDETPSTLDQARRAGAPGLQRRVRALVRVAALLAVDAPTATLRWAVELASATGATDEALAAVLVKTAAETGGAQVVWSASRLALALGFDLEIEGATDSDY